MGYYTYIHTCHPCAYVCEVQCIYFEIIVVASIQDSYNLSSVGVVRRSIHSLIHNPPLTARSQQLYEDDTWYYGRKIETDLYVQKSPYQSSSSSQNLVPELPDPDVGMSTMNNIWTLNLDVGFTINHIPADGCSFCHVEILNHLIT